MRIEDLCREVVNAKLEAGYLESNVWTGYSEFYSPLISFCRNCGEEEFSPEIIARYRAVSYTHLDSGADRRTAGYAPVYLLIRMYRFACRHRCRKLQGIAQLHFTCGGRYLHGKLTPCRLI